MVGTGETAFAAGDVYEFEYATADEGYELICKHDYTNSTHFMKFDQVMKHFIPFHFIEKKYNEFHNL